MPAVRIIIINVTTNEELEGHAPREGEYHLSARIQVAEQTTAKSHVSREGFQHMLGVGLASKPSFTMGTKWPAASPAKWY